MSETKNTGKSYSGLFVTDLDGTLLTDQGVIADMDMKSLAALRKRGNVVVIATGRSNWSFWKLFTNRSLIPVTPPVDFVIFSTGAGIMEFPAGKIISNIQLSPQEVTRVLLTLDRANLDYMVPEPIPRTHHFYYQRNSENRKIRKNRKDNPDFERRLQLYQSTAYPLVEREDVGGATQILVIVPEKQGEDVWRMLSAHLPDLNVIRATSPLDGRSCWIEIFPKMVAKRYAVQWLLERLKIPKGRVGAVGNDYNDEDLLRWAAQGYLTANGPAELKNGFHSVADNNRGGVAEAALSWLEGEGE